MNGIPSSLWFLALFVVVVVVCLVFSICLERWVNRRETRRWNR